MFKRISTLAVLFLSLVVRVGAQDLGTVALRTVPAQLASNSSCTGSAQNFITGAVSGFNNLGQTQHQVSARSNAASFAVEIDGIDVVGTIIRISNPVVSFPNGATTGYVVQGTGYYPNIQVTVTCTSGSTFSMSYTGSSGGGTAIIGAPGSSSFSVLGGIVGNVQGIQPAGSNGAPVFPVVNGIVRPPINAQTLQFGVDTFGVAIFPGTGGATGNAIFTPPTPTKSGEWGLAILSNTALGVVNTFLGPWTCASGGCVTSNTNPQFATLTLASNNNLAINSQNQSGTLIAQSNFFLFGNIAAVRQVQNGNFTTSISTSSNTAAGSTLVAVATCSTLNCNVAPTDSQANTVRPLNSTQLANSGTQGTSTFIIGPTSAAAETITWNAAAGTTLNGSGVIELTGLIPTTLNTPIEAPTGSNPAFSTQENDNGGMFVESGGYSLSQTLTIAAAGTTTIPLWAQTQHGVFSSCTVSLRVTAASGTTPTLNTFLQDSADNAGFNDRLSMPQATAAGNFLGATPTFTASTLAATASSAVTTTDGALAAGSGIAGPIGPFGRIKFVVGGTTPSFTITYNVVCK